MLTMMTENAVTVIECTSLDVNIDDEIDVSVIISVKSS